MSLAPSNARWNHGTHQVGIFTTIRSVQEVPRAADHRKTVDKISRKMSFENIQSWISHTSESDGCEINFGLAGKWMSRG